MKKIVVALAVAAIMALTSGVVMAGEWDHIYDYQEAGKAAYENGRSVAHGTLPGEWDIITPEQQKEIYANATPVRPITKFGWLGPVTDEDFARAYYKTDKPVGSAF